ncbi:hypothetical protein BGZ63DRAFT_207905 [Mariannaea sp. PMI_226]|nr:hypothetical protein BGZ63DRAFT_207905 [Mariannaea sp. PMI_226]
MPRLLSTDSFFVVVIAVLLLGGCLFVLFILLRLNLLRLHGGFVNVPVQSDLENDCDENDEKDGEKDRLVIENGDGLISGANFGEPVEFTHYSQL